MKGEGSNLQSQGIHDLKVSFHSLLLPLLVSPVLFWFNFFPLFPHNLLSCGYTLPFLVLWGERSKKTRVVGRGGEWKARQQGQPGEQATRTHEHGIHLQQGSHRPTRQAPENDNSVDKVHITSKGGISGQSVLITDRTFGHH